jgi:subtilisin family serine protease
MQTRQYIVTLHKREDLNTFYTDMESEGISGGVPFRVCQVDLRRPLSRNTHYKLTDPEAERLRTDPRVLAVELTPDELGFVLRNNIINNTTRNLDGTFWKTGALSSNYRQWGHLHCSGTDSQRDKNGSWSNGTKSDSVNIFNNGAHVDVVVCDDAVSYDCEEWYSPTTGQTRFNRYQWYNELNQYVQDIDNDNITLPTGNITYPSNASNTSYHGVHVTGTVAGQFYGWATEANIYSLQVLGSGAVDVLLLFDYLRAFHLNKPINPETGTRNPTITNHSWGYGYDLRNWFPSGYDISDISNIRAGGNVYSSSNPNPSGWTNQGIKLDFGLGPGVMDIPASYEALRADVYDAIADGVVVIGAAGNDNFMMNGNSDLEWNNSVSFNSGPSTIYFNRGSSPTNSLGVVRVGALDDQSDFRRASFSNYGPAVTLFAPGVSILSSITNPSTSSFGGGLIDTKYNKGSGNWYYPLQGTSMASPQVAGVAALLASANHRFSNDDMFNYIEQHCKTDDMSFDLGDGTFNDVTCSKFSPNVYLLSHNPRVDTGMISKQIGSRLGSGNPAIRFHKWSRHAIFNTQSPGLTIPDTDQESSYQLYGISTVWNLPEGPGTSWTGGETWGAIDDGVWGVPVTWGVTQNLTWDSRPNIDTDTLEINWSDEQTRHIIWGSDDISDDIVWPDIEYEWTNIPYMWNDAATMWND